MNCGRQIDSDSRFCSNCGAQVPVQSAEPSATSSITPMSSNYTPTTNQYVDRQTSLAKQAAETSKSERKTEYEGNLRKCPNCGNLVKAFSATCEFCGHEFRNATNSSMVEEFEAKYQSAKSNKQRILLIQSLAVPNTKEDVLEMFYLAAANVGKSDNKDKELDLAWQAKFEQAYMKTGIVLRDDPERTRVDQFYNEKMVDIKKWKRHVFFQEHGATLGLIGIVVFCFGLLALMAYLSEGRTDADI